MAIAQDAFLKRKKVVGREGCNAVYFDFNGLQNHEGVF